MLQGYKSYIGIGMWAAGAVIVEFFTGSAIEAFGPPLMEFGKVVFGGGAIAKFARYMKAQNIS